MAAGRPPLDRRRGRLAGLADRLGVTEGQVWTLLVAFTVAITSVLGMTAVVRDGATVVRPAEAAARPPLPEGDAPATVDAAPSAPSAEPPRAAVPGATPPAFGPVQQEPLGPAVPASEPAAPAPGLARGELRPFADVGSPGAPEGIARAADGTVWVTANGHPDRGTAPAVLHLDPTGAVRRSYRAGSGGPTVLTGVVATAEGVFVLSSAPAAVWRVDAARGDLVRVAVIPDVGRCIPVAPAAACEDALLDAAPAPRDAVALGGSLLVSDAGQGVIWSVDPASGEVASWARSADFRATAGAGGTAGLTVAPDALLVVVTGSGPLDEPALFRVVIDGRRAGSISRVATLRREDGPSDVAVVPGGYAVTLAAGGAVALLDAGGVETARYGSPATLAHPTGIVTSGSSLLVTDRTRSTVVEVGLTP